ncbi:23S rRNA (guanosine(2251)-2'-O)-methyltransferase RlmB, partial [bacterium]|nr:23S rRNA (guanosine(2251)-2'-O)-methyltransferase RlmB [bacterium]
MNEKNLVWGKNPVIEILEQCPSRINKIYIQENISLDNRLKKIIELAKLNKIVIQKTHLKKL